MARKQGKNNPLSQAPPSHTPSSSNSATNSFSPLDCDQPPPNPHEDRIPPPSHDSKLIDDFVAAKSLTNKTQEGSFVGHSGSHDVDATMEAVSHMEVVSPKVPSFDWNDLLDDQETEFNSIIESIVSLDPLQAKDILQKMDLITEMIKNNSMAVMHEEQNPNPNPAGVQNPKPAGFLSVGVQNPNLTGVQNQNPVGVQNPKIIGVQNPKIVGVQNQNFAGVQNPNSIGVQNSNFEASKIANPTAKEKLATRASVWDTFDISKLRNSGEKLSYKPPTIKEGISLGKIEAEDIKDELSYWQNAVVCVVLGAKPPFPVIQGYLKRVWGEHGIDKILMDPEGRIIVRFNSLEARNKVLEIGVFHFDNKPLFISPWSERSVGAFHTEQIPIWIQLHNLEVKYWGATSLSKIASLVGVPIMVDSMTQSRDRINYARILVEVHPDALPDEIFFENERGHVITQQVTYEWKPSFCANCEKYGHDKKMCRKGQKVVRKEWVVKNKPSQEEVIHVVDSVKLQEQVKEGLISTDQVDASELHPIVATANTQEKKDKAPQQEEWQTVQTRSSIRLMKKKEEAKKLENGGKSTPASGNG